jgi:hypothetical protein
VLDAGLVILGLAGLVLLIIGVRGRRIDTHPICRKCGFDLVGTNLKQAEEGPEPLRCPECGAEVDSPITVRYGHRRRRPRLIALAAIMMLPAISFFSFEAWQTSRGIQWIELMPYGIVRERAVDVESGYPSLEAQAEIVRRMRAGELSDEEMQRLADFALELQCDPTRPLGYW